MFDTGSCVGSSLNQLCSLPLVIAQELCETFELEIQNE